MKLRPAIPLIIILLLFATFSVDILTSVCTSPIKNTVIKNTESGGGDEVSGSGGLES